MSDRPPYLFAGDREVAVEALRRLIALGDPPQVLCTAETTGTSHAEELRDAFRAAGGEHVMAGRSLDRPATLEWLGSLGLSMAVAVQFPHLVRREALAVPERGWVNVHPAFLPHNRGWHTPTWAILEATPAGVTVHEMVEEVDAGGIIARREVEVEPSDTAHRLYQRLLAAEVDLLLETWPVLRSDEPWQTEQPDGGTTHRRAELFDDRVQRLDLNRAECTGVLLDRLRALTTDRWSEAAWFEVDGRRFRVQVTIREEED